MKLQLSPNYLKQHWKFILQLALGLLSILLAVFFIKQEQAELGQVKRVLQEAKIYWLFWGFILIFLFVAVQGLMYQFSFKSVNKKIPFKVGLSLYLKRNFISTFIPAGMVTNVLFFNKEIEDKQGIEKRFIYYASTIFSACSILSSILIIIPSLILLFFMGDLKGDMIYGVIGISVIICLLAFIVISIVKKGFVYHQIIKRLPSLVIIITDLQQQSLNKIQIMKVVLLSFAIEVIGIAHLYIAMGALGITPSLMVAIIGYALVLIILISSPFLRGLGAVELALTYALTLFNYSAVGALSVVLLFRFFEFWSVMILGVIALLFKKDGLFMQLLAPLLLLFLGITNIFSALTPALSYRLKVLRDFIPYDVIEVSNTAVLVIGVILIVSSAALIKGYKNSYYLAMVLASISLVGHFFKGIDYEEAILAALTILVLAYQRKTYYIKSIPLQALKWENALILIASVLIYGTIGFYLLDVRHFNINFTFVESIVNTFKSFVLLDENLKPLTSLGRYFLYSINMLGIASILHFVWLLFRKLKIKAKIDTSEAIIAKQLVRSYGNSSMDYFKTYEDKEFYFFEYGEGFISYKTTSSFAVVLENPVLKDFTPEVFIKKINQFERAMLSQNLNVIYYRIPESSIGIYEALNKKTLLLGEDAYVNLETFTLDGGDAKALRNAVNKIVKSGFIFKVNKAPQNDAFLQQLRQVSDSWLKDMERTELGFSQGYFREGELKNQTILSVENTEGKIMAFLNIIEDSVPGELNFDLMRKTDDAPHGVMDFLFVEMMQNYKELGYRTLCLGMVPLSGIDEPENIAEQVLKLAYERIKLFSHYKSLRFFKEKFKPYWIKVYAAYDTDLDLVNLSKVLSKVMKVKI
ncbi:MAG: phosphatidylglycerol lysyltransferase domain-containing protein [Leeuwenhoekiella sp.]